jgi:hypothetical protein
MHGLWFSLGEEDRMSQREPDNDAAAEETPGDIPAGSGKQFAADVSPAAERAEGGEEPTPEGSGKQFAGEDLSEHRDDQPDDEQGKAFARDVSDETDEPRAPDAPADSGKGFARGAPEPGPDTP